MNSCNNMCKTPCTVMHQMPCDMPSLAMSYVPWQQWGNLYQADEGFHNGTIFKDLNLPFTGRRVC